jgi:hypothetical protein
MYDYALNNGFISNEDQYLDLITERQDLCINMTDLESEEILDAIKEGAAELNNQLQLGLDEGSLIKTGSYRNHTKKTSKNSSELERGENELSLSYSSAVFENKLGSGESKDRRGVR